MGDYLLKYLRGGISRFKKLVKTRKKNSVFIATILMLAMGIFFCAISENYAYAGKSADRYSQFSSFKPEYAESISDLRNIDFNWESLKADNYCQASRMDDSKKTVAENSMENKPVAAEVHPIQDVIGEKMGSLEGLAVKKENFQDKEPESFCTSFQKKRTMTVNSEKEGKILELVAGYPIEEMLPYIASRDEKVAYYLVAIAKKESDWGKHSPSKYGGTCYNYWGYRGKHNQTDSGYSCFDSPEQAIQQVGDRIEALLDKSIDTPEEMVVWKCGSTCSGHDPQGVLKWISDVKLYYGKLST